MLTSRITFLGGHAFIRPPAQGPLLPHDPHKDEADCGTDETDGGDGEQPAPASLRVPAAFLPFPPGP